MRLEARDGGVLTVQAVPGRGWRCSLHGRPPDECVPLYATLRGALIDCIPGIGEDDPWLVAELRRLAPEEAVG
jgi:hypothetical protein